MILTTHSGRVTGPLMFSKTDGKRASIPLGPCLVEEDDEGSVAVFWGQDGELSAVLSPTEASEAANLGNLLLLD